MSISESAAPGGETMTPEQEVDELLREFQRACETVVVRGDSNLSETTKLRAILRNDLRARLLSGCFDVRCIGCGQIGTWRADPDAVSRSSTPTMAATDAPTCDCYTLRLRLNDLRSEQREIAALFGIEPCYDDTPHSWSVGDTGNVSLLALMRNVAARFSSSPSSTTATPDEIPMEHITRFLVSLPKWIPVIAEVDRDEERKKFAVNWWGEANTSLVAEVYDDGHIVFAGPLGHGSRSCCVEALVDIEPQLAALFPSALPSSRALSEEERKIVAAIRSEYHDGYSASYHDTGNLLVMIDRLTGAPHE